jgi:hypothetical protein
MLRPAEAQLSAACARIHWLVRAIENLSGAVVDVSELLSAAVTLHKTTNGASTDQKGQTDDEILLMRDVLELMRDHSVSEAPTHKMSLLRLLVNMTNNNERVGQQVCSFGGLPVVTRVIEAAFDQKEKEKAEAVFLDQLPLAVGVLINCLECTPSSRDAIAALTVRVGSVDAVVGQFASILCAAGVVNSDTHSLSSSSSSSSSESMSCAELFAVLFTQSTTAVDALNETAVKEQGERKKKEAEKSVKRAQSDGLFATAPAVNPKKRKQMGEDREELSSLCVSFRALSSYAGLILGTLALHGQLSSEELLALLGNSTGALHQLAATLQDFLVLQSDARVLTAEALESVVDIVSYLQKAGSVKE